MNDMSSTYGREAKQGIAELARQAFNPIAPNIQRGIRK